MEQDADPSPEKVEALLEENMAGTQPRLSSRPDFSLSRASNDLLLTRKSDLQIYVRLFALCSVVIESGVYLSKSDRAGLFFTVHLAKGC